MVDGTSVPKRDLFLGHQRPDNLDGPLDVLPSDLRHTDGDLPLARRGGGRPGARLLPRAARAREHCRTYRNAAQPPPSSHVCILPYVDVPSQAPTDCEPTEAAGSVKKNVAVCLRTWPPADRAPPRPALN